MNNLNEKNRGKDDNAKEALVELPVDPAPPVPQAPLLSRKSEPLPISKEEFKVFGPWVKQNAINILRCFAKNAKKLID